MERVKPSRLCANPKKLFLSSNKKIDFFNLPLTNFDLIELHSMFMKLTVSHFQTADVLKGRLIVNKILNSLNYYRQIACLSSVQPMPLNSIDIFQIIHKNAQVYGLEHAINQFFIDHMQIDFIWIELTEDLISHFGQSNIDYFIKIMTQYHAMPVIVVHYNS